MRTRSWLGVVLVLAVSACAPEEADPQSARTSAVIANRNLDVLFMVDNSSSMRLQQANLTTNFPMFMDALKALPGGLPNIHVAVISADMGGGTGDIAGCDSTGGDNGIFQYTARGTCTATNLQAGHTYISNVGVDWGQLMAATVLALLPVLFAFLIMQKWLVQGLMAGAVKA